MRALVLAVGLIATHPAWADEPKVEAGAPWQCTILLKEELPPGFSAKISAVIEAGAVLTGSLAGIRKLGPDTVKEDIVFSGSWLQVGKELQVQVKSALTTQMTVNGEAVPKERLQSQNETGASRLAATSWGALKITRLTKTQLQFESEYASFDCRPSRKLGV